MTPNTKRILIETDSRETVVVRTGSLRIPVAYCESCGSETEMVDLDSAVTRSGRGARELIRGIDSGRVHSSQTSTGHLLICAISLNSSERKSETGEALI